MIWMNDIWQMTNMKQHCRLAQIVQHNRCSNRPSHCLHSCVYCQIWALKFAFYVKQLIVYSIVFLDRFSNKCSTSIMIFCLQNINNFWVPNWYLVKIRFVIAIIQVMQSGQSFAYVRRAELSCHVQKCDLIWSLCEMSPSYIVQSSSGLDCSLNLALRMRLKETKESWPDRRCHPEWA